MIKWIFQGEPKVTITYNNGFGKVKVIEKNGVYIIERSAYLRAWQKVTNHFGGLTELVFDTDKKVVQNWE